MKQPTDEELDSIIATLSKDAQRMIKGAIGDQLIGLWIGNGDAAWEVHQRNLTEYEPTDGGGRWGEVAPLNDMGIAVVNRMLKLQTH
jgi:hypothetical protein